MYKVLLADDENLQLETLQDYVDWKELGFSQVFAAKNGRTALALALEHHPDLVITDIRMPLMDGLELAAALREECPETKVVFLTGYDDFSYIRSAFRVDAFDYLLKPFSLDDVRKVVVRVLDSLKKDRLVARSMDLLTDSYLTDLLTCSDEGRRQEAYAGLVRSGRFSSEGSHFFLMQALGHFDPGKSPDISMAEIAFSVKKPDGVLFLVSSAVTPGAAAIRLKNRLKSMGFLAAISYSRESCSPEMLYEKSCSLQKLKEWVFYEGIEKILVLEEHQDAQMEKDTPSLSTETLEKKILSGEEGEVEQMQEEWFQKIREARPCPQRVKKEFFNVYTEIYDRLVSKNDSLKAVMPGKSEEYERLEQADTLEDLCASMKEWIAALVHCFAEQNMDKSGQIVRQVKEYIMKHYQEPLTAEEIGGKIYLSPNYVRNIFKSVTGKTILEWTTEYRFEKACQLLRDRSLKIREISHQVGYENVSYFCSTFNRIFGVSPTEYRQKFCSPTEHDGGGEKA